MAVRTAAAKASPQSSERSPRGVKRGSAELAAGMGLEIVDGHINVGAAAAAEAGLAQKRTYRKKAKKAAEA